MELVPIKVRIGLRPNGKGGVEADHPPFNQLSCTGSTDWAHWVDQNGGGWKYDKKCGHSESDEFNDAVPDKNGEHANLEVGCQYGCLLVPEIFAEQAVALFSGAPYNIKILSEESFETFYNERCCAHMPEIHKDADALKAIADIQALEAGPLKTIDPTPAEIKAREDAVNPDIQTERGLRRNLDRYWEDHKKKHGITIRASERKVVA